MSLTRAQLVTKVQQNLNDAVGTFFDSAVIIDSLQDGYDEVLIDTQCAEGLANVNFASNTLYYDLYNGVIPANKYFWRICRIFNKNTNRWLDVVDSRVLDKFRYDWESAIGTPWFAYIVNFQYLSFFPHYSSAIGSFDVLYKIGKDYLTDDAQVPQIPDEFNRILESYTTAEMLEVYREFRKAQDYWQDYFKLKKKLAEYVTNRSVSARMLQLGAL